MNFFLKIIGFLLLISFSFWLSFADQCSSTDALRSAIDGNGITIVNPCDSSEKFVESELLTNFIPRLVELVFYLSATFAVVWVIFWWVQMFVAWWEEDRYLNWWKSFAYSLIWLFIIIFSRAIVSIVEAINISTETVGGNDGKTVWKEIVEWSDYLERLPDWSIWIVISELINSLLGLVFIGIVWLMLYAWIVYITTDEEDRRSKMWTMMVDSIIWLVVILTSYVLISGFLSIDF